MCAADTKLVRVDEDGVCNYLMDLETPAACAGAGAALRRVRDLERRLAYPHVYAAARMIASSGMRMWSRSMVILLRATGRQPVGEWVPRVEAVLAHCRARAEAWLVRMVS